MMVMRLTRVLTMTIVVSNGRASDDDDEDDYDDDFVDSIASPYADEHGCYQCYVTGAIQQNCAGSTGCFPRFRVCSFLASTGIICKCIVGSLDISTL